MSVMNIIFLSHRVPFPPNKGEKIRTFHQIEYLARRGHSLYVFAPTSGDEDLKHLQALRQGYCAGVFHAPQPGKLAYLKGLVAWQALSISHFYSSSLQHQLDRFLSSVTVDAIVCTSSCMAEYVFRSRRLRDAQGKRPVLVMDFMDLDSDKWRQYEKMKHFPLSLVYRREAVLLARYERKIHHEFDTCLFISANEVELFLQSTPDIGKVKVVGNGMDTESFRPSSQPKPSKGPNLLFTGVMDYLPNEDAVAWFVEGAWNRVRERYPDAQFYIAGMNPSTKVKSLSRYPGVIVTGFVDDIRGYFDSAHVFVAPFRLARGVQNKVLQAFSCGLPTITTAMGCEGIACRAGEHVLVANTLDEIVEQIAWVMTNQNEARDLGARARDLIEREYSWDGKLAELEAILGAPVAGA